LSKDIAKECYSLATRHRTKQGYTIVARHRKRSFNGTAHFGKCKKVVTTPKVPFT
jgi:hypothetical protein